MQNPEHRAESGRNIGERTGALEQDMKVVKHRLDEWDRRHQHSPERLTKLEQQMTHQNEKLDDMEQGISQINVTLQKIATKVTYGLGGAAVFMVMFDKVWPIIAKGLGS